MITYICLGVFVLGFALYLIERKHSEYISDTIGGFLMGGSVVAFLFVSFLGFMALTSRNLLDSDPSCRVDLVALGTGNSSEVQGSWSFLGGSVDGEGFRTITYATQDENGGVRLKQKRADHSVIYEDSPDGEGVMVCVSKPVYYDSSHLWPWAGESLIGYTQPRYEFHVPEGSVVRDFTVAP